MANDIWYEGKRCFRLPHIASNYVLDEQGLGLKKKLRQKNCFSRVNINFNQWPTMKKKEKTLDS